MVNSKEHFLNSETNSLNILRYQQYRIVQLELPLWLREIFTSVWIRQFNLHQRLSCRLWDDQKSQRHRGETANSYQYANNSILHIELDYLSAYLLQINLILKFQIFENCSCIAPSETSSFSLPNSLQNPDKQQKSLGGGTAIGGSCLVDCKKEFILFLIVMCFIKFTSATGRASNFLVSVRCVEERDKTVSMGFGLMFMCLFSFIPSPIFFGYLFDKFCLVWGKTCTGQGNCWLYDGESLRWTLLLQLFFHFYFNLSIFLIFHVFITF